MIQVGYTKVFGLMSYQHWAFEHTHEKCACSKNTKSLWISAIAKLCINNPLLLIVIHVDFCIDLY